ncbi:MAG: aspartate aminotransferase family protein [Candidatus Promineifilaceae bacterium]
MDFIALENQFTSGVYGKRDVCFVRGDGIKLWDDAGKEYLDFGTGISVANLGHAHPRLVNAISKQAATLMTAPELGYNDQRAQLLGKLADLTPEGINRFFLCNSGTEAIEGCLKFAHLTTGRSKFIATMRGFHGRTLGSLGATFNKKYREPFSALTHKFTHVPFGKIEKLAAKINGETAAVLIELVQGEGGIRPGDAAYFNAIRALCDEHGALLIVDEVQTGFGRTGAMFACDHFGLKPDLLAMGKAIAGGVPMGAVGIGDRISGLKPGMHGSTFGGNPLACAAALAHFEVLAEDRLVQNSAEMGQYFLDRLSEINSPLIRDVRGKGLMIGVELKQRVGPVLRAMMERGFMVLNAGPTVLRFLPPLTITTAEIDLAVAALTAVLQELGERA